MAIQQLSPVLFKGRHVPVFWHSDDGCYHAAGHMGADREDLERSLARTEAEDAAKGLAEA